ncbi:MAG: type II secretion system protein [Deltaproteobacteria bacterium]|nr:type II secretion system protein [Deltaproteobacteria bacterium]
MMSVRKNSKGFTLIELVLVITILGILAVAALPSFINVSTQARQASRDGVTGAVRSGIALFRANDLVVNGPPGIYPTTLDSASNAVAGPANLIFTNILSQGVADNRWTRVSDTSYTYNDGTSTFTYTYAPASGSFVSPTAP